MKTPLYVSKSHFLIYFNRWLVARSCKALILSTDSYGNVCLWEFQMPRIIEGSSKRVRVLSNPPQHFSIKGARADFATSSLRGSVWRRLSKRCNIMKLQGRAILNPVVLHDAARYVSSGWRSSCNILLFSKAPCKQDTPINIKLYLQAISQILVPNADSQKMHHSSPHCSAPTCLFSQIERRTP